MVDVADGPTIGVFTDAFHEVGFDFPGIEYLVHDLDPIGEVQVIHSRELYLLPDDLLERGHVRDVDECAVPGPHGVAQQLGLLDECQ